MKKIIFAAALGAAAFVASGAMAEGDPAKGQKIVAKKCKSCHMVADGDNVIVKGGKVGPNLFGVIGRPAGSFDGFKYSKSMKAANAAGLVWNAEEVDHFIKDPKKFIRAYLDDKKAKSKMTFKLKKESQRADVVAFLSSLNN